jgi:hypothetical protein
MNADAYSERDDFISWLESPNWTGQEMSEEDWNDYIHIVTDEEFTECDYLVGYYDMDVYGEQVVRASDEEFAIDGFLTNYQSKKGYAPYIARCETVYEAKERIAAGDTGLPEDGQFERYADFGNAYYEALNN